MAKKIGLGRGLDALIQDKKISPNTGSAQADSGVSMVKISRITTNPLQPRQNFCDDALQELTDSVKEHGVLQPLLARKKANRIVLIAGERRLRAAKLAELADVPVMFLDVSDQDALEIALLENLQREDLNLMEEAAGYSELANQFKLTQEQIAERVGKARASVANILRLLDLPTSVQALLQSGELSAGHGKVLLRVEVDLEKELLATRCVKEHLSVRALEKIVEKLTLPPKKARAQKNDLPGDYVRQLSDKLHKHFGTAVKINSSKTLANGKKVKGSIEIDYHSTNDLSRMLELFGLDPSSK